MAKKPRTTTLSEELWEHVDKNTELWENHSTAIERMLWEHKELKK